MRRILFAAALTLAALPSVAMAHAKLLSTARPPTPLSRSLPS